MKITKADMESCNECIYLHKDWEDSKCGLGLTDIRNAFMYKELDYHQGCDVSIYKHTHQINSCSSAKILKKVKEDLFSRELKKEIYYKKINPYDNSLTFKSKKEVDNEIKNHKNFSSIEEFKKMEFRKVYLDKSKVWIITFVED